MSEFTDVEMQAVGLGEKIPLPNHLNGANIPKEFCSDDACPIDISADAVNHPSHYTSGGIECIDAIRESMAPMEFHRKAESRIWKRPMSISGGSLSLPQRRRSKNV